MRQIFLDTETTGLDPNQGHRIIEIAAIEMNNRQLTQNYYHTYLNPERDIDSAAQEVHGITLEFLQDKPLFKNVASEFLNFIKDSEIIIHNAPFDVGFINMELGKISFDKLEAHAFSIFDTLKLAKEIRPGQRNNLDALCKAYGVDNTSRAFHGALLDAELLCEDALIENYIDTILGCSNENAQNWYCDQEENECIAFGVNIIPHTAKQTSFGAVQRGTHVNLEVDMLARYVARLSQP